MRKFAIVSADRHLAERAMVDLSIYLRSLTSNVEIIDSPIKQAEELNLITADSKRALLPVEAFYLSAFSVANTLRLISSVVDVSVSVHFPVYFYSVADIYRKYDDAWNIVREYLYPVLVKLSEAAIVLGPELTIIYIESVRDMELASKIYSDLQLFHFNFVFVPGESGFDWNELILL